MREAFERKDAAFIYIYVDLTTQSDPTRQGDFGLVEDQVSDCLIYVYINMYPSAAPGPPLDE